MAFLSKNLSFNGTNIPFLLFSIISLHPGTLVVIIGKDIIKQPYKKRRGTFKIRGQISNETITSIKELKDPSKIADNIASHLNTSISEKQQIFETNDVKKRINLIIKIMENETSIIGVEKMGWHAVLQRREQLPP